MKYLLIIQIFTSHNFINIDTQTFDNYQQCEKAKNIIESISKNKGAVSFEFKPILKSAKCYKIS